MTQHTFAHLALGAIASSLTNPRKTFDAAKLAELTESIKASGVHQPVLVRPLPGHRLEDTAHLKPRPEYELVAGERRLRASIAAGVATIPAMIAQLTDDQALEVQIVENLQRDDLSELEEAEGYEHLMRHSNLSAEGVAGKIGKSRSYVYGRLKLLDLCMEGQQAMREGQIDASRALLIARIPDSKLQIKALDFATKPGGYPPELPSVRRLQDWLKVNVMLRLDQAVFKLTDVRLVEAAGSCADCPKRTGANPDLFADVDSADICTDPACFHGKEEAHRAQLVKKAEAKGLRIVQDKEALELIEGNQYRNRPAGYTNLNEARPDLSQEGERPITLAQALGKDAPAPILFVHPRTQEISELVPAAEAEAVLLAKGLINAEKRRADKVNGLTDELEHLKRAAQRDVDIASTEAIHEATAQAIRQTDTAQAKQLLTGEVVRAWLLNELDHIGEDNMASICGYEFAEGVDEMDAMTMHLQRMGDTDLLRTLALWLLDSVRSFNPTELDPVATAFAKALNVDTKAIQRTAASTVKKEIAARIKVVQDRLEAQKAPLPLPPAAQASGVRGGGDPNESSKGKNPGKRKGAKAQAAPALSAEEAMQGIAAAMQGREEAVADSGHGESEPVGGAAAEGLNERPAADEGPAVESGQTLELKIGARVRVMDDGEAFGGKRGVVEEKNPHTGEWIVKLEGMDSGYRFWPSELEVLPDTPATDAQAPTDGATDPVYQAAKATVINNNKASISYVQRVHSIGYRRAAAILQAMQDEGLVSEPNDKNVRTVMEGAQA